MPFSAGALLAAAVLTVTTLPVLSEGLIARSQTRVDGPARTPDIHFTPTRHAIADAMLRLANVTADDVVYDLGSGDGRVVVIAPHKYRAGRLVELSGRIANEAEVATRVSFIVGDLFEADLSKATVVTMYLSPSIMKILEPKLRALKPGTRIVSHQFAMPRWLPDKKIQVDESELLLWIVPESR